MNWITPDEQFLVFFFVVVFCSASTLRRMLQHCFAVKIQKCFVDYGSYPLGQRQTCKTHFTVAKVTAWSHCKKHQHCRCTINESVGRHGEHYGFRLFSRFVFYLHVTEEIPVCFCMHACIQRFTSTSHLCNGSTFIARWHDWQVEMTSLTFKSLSFPSAE